MNKIPTIFDRNWDGGRGVIDKWVVDEDNISILNSTATEKIDGTNVRLTLRNGFVVRVEKRRNPSKTQKQQGIIEPWYVDADPNDPQDKHIWKAVSYRTYDSIPDGEWSGEAVGPGIQGNYYNLVDPTVVLFSYGEAPILNGVPVTYDGLKDWLPNQMSALNGAVPIEGVVWHHDNNSEMFKIKTKDFK